MPTMIVFKDGEEKKRFVGVQPALKILEAIESHL
jgi:thioredoxin-like negative regulator of GroEL